jgi:hypothetical protein
MQSHANSPKLRGRGQGITLDITPTVWRDTMPVPVAQLHSHHLYLEVVMTKDEVLIQAGLNCTASLHHVFCHLLSFPFATPSVDRGGE